MKAGTNDNFYDNLSTGDITFLVSTSPQHGYLEIQSITSDDEYNSKVFDQSTINSEKSRANDPSEVFKSKLKSFQCFTFKLA